MSNTARHLSRVIDQMHSVLFYMRNASQVAEVLTLYHKQSGYDHLRYRDMTDEQAHATVQTLFRQIEQQAREIRPAEFKGAIEGLNLLYMRFRSGYVATYPERNQWLVEQPAPNKVDVPVFPVRENYVGNYDDFYRAFFAETIAQVDAYRWMCQLDKYAVDGAEADLPVPFEDTVSRHDWGWRSIEEVSYSLMRTLLSNHSSLHPVCAPLADYGTRAALKNLAVLSDHMEVWIAEGMNARREKRNEQ